MKIYIRHIDDGREIINKLRIPVSLFLNSITARIAASAVVRDFKKDILKALEKSKYKGELQGSYVSQDYDKTIAKDNYSDNKDADINDRDIRILSDANLITDDKTSEKYTLVFADGTTIERRAGELKKNNNPTKSQKSVEVDPSNKNSLIKSYGTGCNNSFVTPSGDCLRTIKEELIELKKLKGNKFNTTFHKYQKMLKRQRKQEFNQLFKALKKAGKQNKGLHLVDISSSDGTRIIIEF